MAIDFETLIYLECSILMLQNAIKSIKKQELIFLEFQSIIALNNFFYVVLSITVVVEKTNWITHYNALW